MLRDDLVTLQVIFGYGVGGEYPIASSSAAERAEADKQLQFKRGETVILVFAMQVSLISTPLLCTFTTISQGICNWLMFTVSRTVACVTLCVMQCSIAPAATCCYWLFTPGM